MVKVEESSSNVIGGTESKQQQLAYKTEDQMSRQNPTHLLKTGHSATNPATGSLNPSASQATILDHKLSKEFSILNEPQCVFNEDLDADLSLADGKSNILKKDCIEK